MGQCHPLERKPGDRAEDDVEELLLPKIGDTEYELFMKSTLRLAESESPDKNLVEEKLERHFINDSSIEGKIEEETKSKTLLDENEDLKKQLEKTQKEKLVLSLLTKKLEALLKVNDDLLSKRDEVKQSVIDNLRKQVQMGKKVLKEEMNKVSNLEKKCSNLKKGIESQTIAYKERETAYKLKKLEEKTEKNRALKEEMDKYKLLIEEKDDLVKYLQEENKKYEDLSIMKGELQNTMKTESARNKLCFINELGQLRRVVEKVCADNERKEVKTDEMINRVAGLEAHCKRLVVEKADVTKADNGVEKKLETIMDMLNEHIVVNGKKCEDVLVECPIENESSDDDYLKL